MLLRPDTLPEPFITYMDIFAADIHWKRRTRWKVLPCAERRLPDRILSHRSSLHPPQGKVW